MLFTHITHNCITKQCVTSTVSEALLNHPMVKIPQLSSPTSSNVLCDFIGLKIKCERLVALVNTRGTNADDAPVCSYQKEPNVNKVGQIQALKTLTAKMQELVFCPINVNNLYVWIICKQDFFLLIGNLQIRMQDMGFFSKALLKIHLAHLFSAPSPLP